jgi:hypothetical protein
MNKEKIPFWKKEEWLKDCDENTKSKIINSHHEELDFDVKNNKINLRLDDGSLIELCLRDGQTNEVLDVKLRKSD